MHISLPVQFTNLLVYGNFLLRPLLHKVNVEVGISEHYWTLLPSFLSCFKGIGTEIRFGRCGQHVMLMPGLPGNYECWNVGTSSGTQNALEVSRKQ